MPRDSSPTIKEFKVRAVRVPMTEPHRTASGVITESPLVLTDIVTDTGITGHSMVFTYTPAALKPTADLICNLEALVKGELLAPVEIEQKLAKRFRLLGTQGLVGIALAAIDMALWDALARVHCVPLVRLLGGAEKPLRPYGAVGYDGVEGCAKAAEGWATRGFTGIKAKIGYPTVQEDVAVVRAMRKAAGPEMLIMVDYNQCLTPTEAVGRLRVLDDEGLTWIEEPTLAHDYAGHALVAREARTPIQMRRELVGNIGHGARHRSARIRLGDARRNEDWRSNWLAQSRGARARQRYPSFQPPVARDQCAPSVLHSDSAPVGVCGLVEPNSRRTAARRERHGDCQRRHRHRGGLERRRCAPFCSLKVRWSRVSGIDRGLGLS